MSTSSPSRLVPRVPVRDLVPGDRIETVYVCAAKEIRHNKHGQPYLSLTLADRSGDVQAFVWNDVEEISPSFETGDVIVVRGAVQNYQGRTQVVVHRARRAADDEFEEQELRAGHEVDTDQLMLRLENLVASIENPWIRGLLENILDQQELKDRLRRWPAAKTMHHAYRGGLLEHVVSVAELADRVAGHYPDVDRSRLLFGAILHDFGKIWELDEQPGGDYTDEGRLIGHLVLETLFVDRLIEKTPGFPAGLRLELLHILLAHHGRYEYGSPKRPKTREALLVHHLDDMDSKLQGMREAIARAAPDDSWSPFSRILERNVFRGSDDGS